MRTAERLKSISRWSRCERGCRHRLRLLGGLVAHEIMMRLAVNLAMVSYKRGQPPRRASDALVVLTAQSGTLCCGRVESKALGRVVFVRRIEHVGPAGDGLGGHLRRTA